MNGKYQIVYGIDFKGTTLSIGNKSLAQSPKVWHCRFNGNPSANIDILLRLYNTDSTEIAYCSFRNHAGRGIVMAPKTTKCVHIRRCHFEEQPYAPQNATEAIQLYGIKEGGQNYWVDGVIEQNYFYRWKNDGEVISIKIPGMTVRQNTLVESIAISNRANAPSRYESNYLIRCKIGLINKGGMFSEWGNLFLNNLLEDCTGSIHIMAGTQEIHGTQGGSRYPRSYYTVFSGNTSNIPLVIGYAPSWSDDLPAKHTRVRQHSGPIEFGFHENTDSQPNVKETLFKWVDRIVLTPKDVGPFAADR
jgi:hypothetical protein